MSVTEWKAKGCLLACATCATKWYEVVLTTSETRQMVKGMNADWGVAFGIFLAFVVWSFTFYLGFFPSAPGVEEGLDAVSGNAMKGLEVMGYAMPVEHSASQAGQAVLFAEPGIPAGMEPGAGVFSGGSRLDCMLSGDKLYWEADLQAGLNPFEIVYSEVDTGWCGDALDTADANQTYPLAAVGSAMVSVSGLSALQAMDYQDYRQSLGVQNELRIEWSGDSEGSLGPPAPGNRDVFVREFSRQILEGGSVDIRILMWE